MGGTGPGTGLVESCGDLYSLVVLHYFFLVSESVTRLDTNLEE